MSDNKRKEEKKKHRLNIDIPVDEAVEEIKEPHYEAPHTRDFDGASFDFSDVDVGTREDVEAVMRT